MQELGRGTPEVDDAVARYRDAERDFHSREDVVVSGELVPLFRDGPGSWNRITSYNVCYTKLLRPPD